MERHPAASPPTYRALTAPEPRVLAPGQLTSAVRLSDAAGIDLQHHAKGADRKFATDCDRVIRMMIDRAGDLPSELYSGDHAEEFRDHVAAHHITGTVRRYPNTLVFIINKAYRDDLS